ncbi:MAG: hypothetical protein C5B50_06890 [Verrucomicrobia bacterium]|nr:MAG: hypothetical protein C5B50_06890 [Verrucomicrobiota bacterium]
MNPARTAAATNATAQFAGNDEKLVGYGNVVAGLEHHRIGADASHGTRDDKARKGKNGNRPGWGLLDASFDDCARHDRVRRLEGRSVKHATGDDVGGWGISAGLLAKIDIPRPIVGGKRSGYVGAGDGGGCGQKQTTDHGPQTTDYGPRTTDH